MYLFMISESFWIFFLIISQNNWEILEKCIFLVQIQLILLKVLKKFTKFSLLQNWGKEKKKTPLFMTFSQLLRLH